MTPTPALTLERRMTVKGWKMRGGKRDEFSSTSYVVSDGSIEYERKRIGEHVEHEWQPHITEVIVEYRWVTPWAAHHGACAGRRCWCGSGRCTGSRATNNANCEDSQ